MGCPGHWVRANAGPLLLTGAAAVLLALLVAADSRLGLHRHASNRYRFHAVPVAVSQLHHGRAYDYTAFRTLAHRFHDGSRDLDDQIAEAIRADPGTDTYFWVADDRGLSDFVASAFRLFGPEVRSLSRFWFLLLAAAVGLFVVGYWKTPAALALPVFVLFGLLVLAESLPFRARIPFDGRHWQEDIALYESRLFDALALLSVLHLALLACGAKPGRAAWLAAVPQAGLLLFLYHARSSLGWQYLALFALVGGRVAWCLWQRRRRELGPPLVIAGLLAVSLVGLKQYQRATYHPAYFADTGPRTFWHNALMGLSHHPRLRDGLPMRQCEDRDAVDFVLRRMEERDPNLDRNRWNWMAALNSLGSHNPFDWPTYEAAARREYLELWRHHPGRMTACYAIHKPLALARLWAVALRLVAKEAVAGRAWELLAGIGVAVCASLMLIRRGRQDAVVRGELRRSALVLLTLVPFALIPGIAFYPALPTTAGFLVAAVALTGVLQLQGALFVRAGSVSGATNGRVHPSLTLPALTNRPPRTTLTAEATPCRSTSSPPYLSRSRWVPSCCCRRSCWCCRTGR
jgi:hypothetical protein